MNVLHTKIASMKSRSIIGDVQIRFCKVDLSENALSNVTFDIGDAFKFEEFIDQHLKTNTADVAVGGYQERRNIYQRSTIFNDSAAEERNIHMGIDLWTGAGTPIKAPIEGKIHSYNDNLGVGNYGPTIILEHCIDGLSFFTLYGHLSRESLNNIAANAHVDAGEIFCYLGDASINGDYAPHLHFQIILNIGDNEGDFAGVCAQTELEDFSQNCPDPNLLLKLIP